MCVVLQNILLLIDSFSQDFESTSRKNRNIFHDIKSDSVWCNNTQYKHCASFGNLHPLFHLTLYMSYHLMDSIQVVECALITGNQALSLCRHHRAPHEIVNSRNTSIIMKNNTVWERNMFFLSLILLYGPNDGPCVRHCQQYPLKSFLGGGV